jgi:hypothetical protein
MKIPTTGHISDSLAYKIRRVAGFLRWLWILLQDKPRIIDSHDRKLM